MVQRRRSLGFPAGADHRLRNGLFGANDPVSREQLVTILWRQEGSPASQTEAGFADSSTIATWATQAVAWAKENNVIAGRSGSRFSGSASQSTVANWVNGLDLPEP